MSNCESHEYLCSILAKLVDSVLTSDELRDLAIALDITVEEFYGPTPDEQPVNIEMFWRL